MVHDADDLDDATMLAFARETRAPETTYVQSADLEGADYRNRIFMTRHELPFAGHPSLGTAVAVARARGERNARYVQQTGAGLQAIDVELDGRVGRASMTQEPPEFGEELEAADVLAAVGLAAGAAVDDLPPQMVSTGLPQLIVPVNDPGLLERCEPVPAALRALIGRTGATVVYVVACELEDARARARSFFLSATGQPDEDPATGSAAGPLVAYLQRRAGVSVVRIEQGVEMGRASVLDASIDGEEVSVSGNVVVLAEGTVDL